MATLKQHKAAERMVENGGNVSKAMTQAGYMPKTAKNPKKLTESKGFKEIMRHYGLTDELVVSALVEDIKIKPAKRIRELEVGAKMLGLLKDRSEVDITGKIGVLIYRPEKYKEIKRNEISS